MTSRTEELFWPQTEPARMKRSERIESTLALRGRARIEGDQVVIRYGIFQLPMLFRAAVEAGAILPDLLGRDLVISDPQACAVDLVRALHEEDETGATLLDGVLDDAMELAIGFLDGAAWLRDQREPVEHDCGEDTCVCADGDGQ